MTNIPLQHLQAFVVFGESVNIVTAAKTLGITQPALSKQLKALDKKMPQPLFTFSGRKKVLTPFAQDLLRELSARLNGIQSLVHQTELLHDDGQTARVRFAARRGVLDRCSDQIRFPGQIYFSEMTNEAMIEALLQRKIEIAVLHDPPSSPEIIAKKLFNENFQLVIPKSLLREKRGLGKKLFTELAILPGIAYKSQDEVLAKLCGAYEMDYQKLRIQRVTESYSSIASMVDAGMGWAALPAYLSVSNTKNWILPIPVELVTLREFYLTYRKEFHKTKWFQNLLNEIKTCF
ncbi:MAG: LysR family transcriptional regulator [Bdellovibrionales bacterium]|nr:LysR family transcriptional regulator [Bdellovibrionales bacterium]